MENLSIGAVARLTGIPAHTLRKWESRHSIAVPFRTETGRRTYSADHVEQLKLVKVLVEHRHALAQLAELSLPELRRMADLHDQVESTDQGIESSAVALVGPNVSRLLSASGSVALRSGGDFADWDGLNGVDCDTLVIECDTLPESVVARIVGFRERDRQVIVVYRYIRKGVMRQLVKQGILLAKGPISDDALRSLIRFDAAPPKTTAANVKFSTEELARIAALSPSIECECPKHIAQLLMDISSFERYSLECEDADPLQRALHGHLASISAQARCLFEDALIAVATSDGLSVETIN